MNVSYLINLLTTIRMELNSVLVMGFLDGGSFTIKSNKTELYACSGTYSNYNSLYGKCLEFLVLWHMYFRRCSSTNFFICGK